MMTHPGRSAAAQKLETDNPDFRMRIIPEPEAEHPAPTLRTAELAWGAVAEGATHHLVLHDDMVLSPGSHAAILRAAAAIPDQPLAFFTNWGSRTAQLVRLAALTGATWAPVIDPYTPTQALLLPAQTAREFSGQAGRLDGDTPYSQAISAFIKERHMTTLVCTPNLVDHTPVESLPWDDAMLGARKSVLFPDKEVPADVIGAQVVPTLSIPHFESTGGHCVIYSHATAGRMTAESVAAHESLVTSGMSNGDIIGIFHADLDRNPAAAPDASGFAYPFVFQLWLTIYTFGIAASRLLNSAHPRELEEALERPWAQQALETFPAGTVRRLVPADRIASVSERFLPLCMDGLRSGFIAPHAWPRLLDAFSCDQEPRRGRRPAQERPGVVIADLDDTLIPDVPAARSAVARTLASLTAPSGPDAVDLVFEWARLTWRQNPHRRSPELRGVSSWEALWLDPERAGLTGPETAWLHDHTLRVWQAALCELTGNAAHAATAADEFVTHRQVLTVPFPDVCSTLASLSQRHELWLATEGNPSLQRTKIEASGLGQWFDRVFISSEVGHAKTAPGFVQVLERELTSEGRNVCFVAGNSMDRDIRLARAGRWPAVHICGSDRCAQEGTGTLHYRTFGEAADFCTCP